MPLALLINAAVFTTTKDLSFSTDEIAALAGISGFCNIVSVLFYGVPAPTV